MIVNALSCDVEDYYMVSAFERTVSRSDWTRHESRAAANTERVLRILSDCGVRATFFVLGWLAEREPSIVRGIAAEGHEVAAHGWDHRLVYEMTPGEFREDVRRARLELQAASGQPVLGYRAPSFSVTERSLWALDILAEEGYAYDASIFPIRHDRYGIPSAPRHAFKVDGWEPARRAAAGGAGEGSHRGLLEIPASTARMWGVNMPISGGGYFRLLPYWWTRAGIQRLNDTEGKPAVFYFHPWEIDPEQPRLPASGLSRFRHYRNLEKTASRLARLLADFRFGTLSQTFLVQAPAGGA